MDEIETKWNNLLNQGRRKKEASNNINDQSKDIVDEVRTEIERDYDRILFSTPVRRLADKTQVFPLDKNDSVRTRLTHSHEVSNLARSLGTSLAFKHNITNGIKDSQRNIPSLLAAIGLVHDLGNPPFGHQGEAAIQSWFEEHQKIVLDAEKDELTPQQKQDFIKFEGNAQGFRLVTRLQLLNDNFGLDLTYATLGAMMKYTVGSTDVNSNKKGAVARKKHGYFTAEKDIACQVLAKLGLTPGDRHPLAYVMEACDDIAYVVLDVEDAVKKGLSSFSDLISFLKHHGNSDPLVEKIVSESCEKHEEYRKEESLSPAELNDVSMQRFRVFAIGHMMRAATDAFLKNKDSLIKGKSEKGLMELSEGEILRKLLKEFGYKHAYTHKSVLELELQGHNVIRGLMDIFWTSIIDCDYTKPSEGNIIDVKEPKRRHPFSRYVYGRISENYRRIYENPTDEVAKMPRRYRECLLLTDMISGMTDSFAIGLYKELSIIRGNFPLATVSAG